MNTIYHDSIGKKPINADYSNLTGKLKQILQLLNLKLVIEYRIMKYKNIFNRSCIKNWSKEILRLILCWKLILRRKDLNEKTIVGNFFEKELTAEWIIKELLSRTSQLYLR